MTEDQQQQKLSALLRLKRFEQPPPGYFDRLVQDVHRRQRADLLRRPLWQIAIERVQTFFGEHSMSRLQYGGAMAAVLVTGLSIFGISSPSKPGAARATALASNPPLPPVADRTDDTSHPKFLSLQEAQESPMAMAAGSLEEPVANARLLPGHITPPSSIGRQPRYIIDTRPASYEVTPASFRF